MYNKCLKKFVKVDKENYLDYIKEAYSDLESAEKEDNEKWAITKAYQSLFLMCNALLVKNLGYYSKDHGCVIIALIKNKIISNETNEKISTILNKKQEINKAETIGKNSQILEKKQEVNLKPKKDFFEEISNIRITRNKYLYLPKAQRKLNVSHKDIINEIKEVIKLLGEEDD